MVTGDNRRQHHFFVPLQTAIVVFVDDGNTFCKRPQIPLRTYSTVIAIILLHAKPTDCWIRIKLFSRQGNVLLGVCENRRIWGWEILVSSHRYNHVVDQSVVIHRNLNIENHHLCIFPAVYLPTHDSEEIDSSRRRRVGWLPNLIICSGRISRISRSCNPVTVSV